MASFFDAMQNQNRTGEQHQEQERDPIVDLVSSVGTSLVALGDLVAQEVTLESVLGALTSGNQIREENNEILFTIMSLMEEWTSLWTEETDRTGEWRETETDRYRSDRSRSDSNDRRGTIFERLWYNRNEKNKKTSDKKLLDTLEEMGESFSRNLENVYNGIKDLAIADFISSQSGGITNAITEQVEEMRKARTTLGLSAQDWGVWNEDMMKTVNNMNDRFDNLFSASDAYGAINTLIEAGVRDQDELNAMMEPLMKYNKAFGDISADSLEWMKKYYREYGVDVINQVGDDVAWLSQNFGILPQELIKAFDDSSLLNSMMKYSAGNAENIEHSNKQLLGAITMLEDADLNSEDLMRTMTKVMDLSDVELGEDFAVSLQAFGIDVRTMRDELRNGNFMDVTNDFVQKIGNAYMSNQSYYDSLADVVGFDKDMLTEISTFKDDVGDNYRQIAAGIENTAGTLDQRLDNYPASIVERFFNGISTSPWFQKVVEIWDALGLSVSDMYFLLASGKLIGGTIKDFGSWILKKIGVGSGGSGGAGGGGLLRTGATAVKNFFSAGFGGAGANTAAGKLGMDIFGFGAPGGMATLGTGGAMSAGALATGAMGVGGLAMMGMDAYHGVEKSQEWLGEERGSELRGKIESGVGAALGGTGPGAFDEDANLKDTGLNVLGNAGKGALIGGTIGSIIPGAGTAIGAAIGGGIGAITGLIGGEKISQAIDWVGDRFGDLWEGAKDLAGKAWEGIKDISGKAVQAVDTGVTTVMDKTLGEHGVAAWEKVKETGANVVGIWQDDSKSFWEKLGETGSEVWSGIKGTASEVWEGVKDKAGEVVQAADKGITKVMDATLGEHGVAAWEGIKTRASEVMEAWNDDSRSIWNKIGFTAGEVWGGIRDTASEVWEGVKDKASQAWEGIKGWASNTWESIKDKASEVVKAADEGITNVMDKTLGEHGVAAWEDIKSTASNIWSTWNDDSLSFGEKLTQSGSQAWEGISSAASNVWEGIKQKASEAWEGIKGWASNTWESVKGWASETWENTKQWASDAWSSIQETASGAIAAADEGITNVMQLTLGEKGVEAWNTLKSTGSEIVGIWQNDNLSFWDKVKTTGSTAWEGISSSFSSLWEGVTNKVKDGFNKVKDSFKSGIDSIKSWASNTWESIKSGASDFIAGFTEGSHAAGLESVPHDGYIAELHKDEMVLPKSTADVLRSITESLGLTENIQTVGTLIKQVASGIKETSSKGVLNSILSLLKVKKTLLRVEGSHKSGLESVPHDGYIAELHKDEMVLPKSEADTLRENREHTIPTVGDFIRTLGVINKSIVGNLKGTEIGKGGPSSSVSEEVKQQRARAASLAREWQSQYEDKDVIPDFHEYVAKVRPLLKLVTNYQATENSSSGEYVGTGSGKHPFSGYNITSPYGPRIHPITGKQSMHNGVDFGISGGTKLPAVEPGTATRRLTNTAGNVISLVGDSGRFFEYMHQSNETFGIGATAKHVDKGQVISSVGTTRQEMGQYSTGPHLHFGYKPNGQSGSYADPMSYLNNYEALTGAAVTTPVPTSGKRAKIVSAARGALGKKYIWGGEMYDTGYQGADCSGLVYYAYNEAGLGNQIGGRQTATGYYRKADKVQSSALQPGDVVFSRVSGSEAGHIGLYAGEGETIEAGSSSTGIHTSNISKWQAYGKLLSDAVMGTSTGVGGPDTPVSNEAPSTSNPTRYIWQVLRGKGISAAGVAGIMGNMESESGFKPTNMQDSYERKLGKNDSTYTSGVDNGTYTNFVHDSVGYGLSQWTYWSLKQGLLNLKKSTGKSIGDLSLQTEYAYKSLESDYSSLLNRLKSTTSVSEASNMYLLQYERPANQSQAVQNKRAAQAQKWYNEYSGLAGASAGDIQTPQVGTADLSTETTKLMTNSDLPTQQWVVNAEQQAVVRELRNTTMKLERKLEEVSGKRYPGTPTSMPPTTIAQYAG